MNKRFYHNLISLLSIFILAGGALAPSFAFAQTAKDYSHQLSQAREKIVQTMSDQKAKVLDEASKQAAQAAARTATDDETKQARIKYDAALDKTYTDLKQKAAAPAEKQAVEKFNTNVRGAVTERRGIVDTATGDYRSGFDNLMTSKVTTLSQAIDSYVASSTATIDQAQNNLTQGAPVPAVKTFVRQNLADADQKLKQVKNKNYADDLKRLENDRSKTVQKADTNLTQTLNQNEKDLRSAFGGRL